MKMENAKLSCLMFPTTVTVKLTIAIISHGCSSSTTLEPNKVICDFILVIAFWTVLTEMNYYAQSHRVHTLNCHLILHTR